MMKENMTFCAPCLLGVEGLVAEELRDMGCENVRAENGRVLFEGDYATLVRANLNSRYSERILILLKSFRATTFEQLFEGVKSIPWENFLHQEDEFPVSGSSLSSKLYSVPDCQAIIKKAVVERLKTKYHVSWFQETGPLHRIRFRLLKDEASVMLDTSGEGLHKRGYRRNSAEAPIKETLAACLVKLARVRPDGNFIDPFCGSGTLLIEAAMLAMNMAPGANRAFQAERWLDAQPKVWQAERERAVSLAKTDVAFRAVGYDIDPAAVSLSLENAKRVSLPMFGQRFGMSASFRRRDPSDALSAIRLMERGCWTCGRQKSSTRSWENGLNAEKAGAIASLRRMRSLRTCSAERRTNAGNFITA